MPVDSAHLTLPAGEHFGRPRHDLLIKVEVFLFKRRRKIFRGGMDEVPAEVGAPVVERDGFEKGVYGFEEFWLADDERFGVRQVERLEEEGDVEIGGKGFEFWSGFGIVIGFIIAELNGSAGCLGELRFDLQNGVGIGGGGVGGVAEEGKHGGHVIMIFGADVE